MGEITITWLMLSFICFVLPYEVVNSTNSSRIPEERSALLQFKNSFSIQDGIYGECESPYPRTLSWGNNSDYCSWDGVKCDRVTGNVIELDLSCSQLKGTINPNTTSGLLHLSHLQRLNLAYNFFSSSSIPSEFGRFVSLTHLNLTYSGFEGRVPSEIWYLSKLISLDLSVNSIKFDLHEFDLVWRNLTHLEELVLESTEINSTIPDSFMNLSSLAIVNLEGTRLRGNLPGHIFRLPNLRELRLGGNDLTGNFPYLESVNRSSLERLDLGYNDLLAGELPDSIGSLESLIFLDISNTGLTGGIPISIGNLKSLSYLDLSITTLTGELPDSIGELKSLSIVMLFYTNLTGELPESIGNMESLLGLVLSNTKLRGKIPDSIGKLKRLRTLDLSNTKMTGELPESIGKLESLNNLNLQNCNFTGSIPKSIGNLKELVSLTLSSNHLTGNIPDGLVSLSKIEEIDISENELTGPIPYNASGFQNLESLLHGNNKINGTLPLWLFTLPSLKSLNLSFNQFSGQIHEFQYGSSLESIDLRNNHLEGPIPHSIMDLTNLTILSLSSNNLSNAFDPLIFSKLKLSLLDLSHNSLPGSFPVPPVSLNYFLISNNKFTGGISTSVCNLTYATIIDVSYNDLSGPIPQCLLNASVPGVLDMQKNRLNGTIPPISAATCSLQTLNLNGNDLEGPVPQSLANCSELELLDLGSNRFNGSFPVWLETFPKLQVLVLHSNKFQGPLGTLTETESPFPALRIFDLSDNEFTHTLPERYFDNFEAMKQLSEGQTDLKYMGSPQGYYENSITLVWKGSEVQLVRILSTLTAIDLSVNRFVGGIPEAIRELHSLRLLNLSHNSISGHIPTLMGNLIQLEALDLSSNELTGSIPGTIANVKSLAKFNVSRNHLFGPIPQGNQFNTFENDSYIENSGLCGFPLSNLCGDNMEPSQPKVEEEDEDYSIFSGDFTWQIVLFGYGCGVPIGLLIGILMLYFKRPIWFQTMVVREEQRIANGLKANDDMRRRRRDHQT